MENTLVRLASLGLALPPCRISQDEAAGLSALHYKDRLSQRGMDLLLQAINHPSIRFRNFAVDGIGSITELKTESQDARMARFTRWALTLAHDAANKALKAADVSPGEVTAVFVNTCTGYICPGISTYLIEKMGLRPDIAAFDLVGSGCGGALPNLQLGESHVLRRAGNIALCISVEICTATFQMDNDPSLLISNAIFGDGAAAALIWDRPRGMRLAASASRFLPAHRDDVRYVYKNGQLHNRLSSQLPKIIRDTVPDFIRSFIAGRGLAVCDIGAWALHPGGDKMVTALQEALGLSDGAMAPTRTILREHGNMSSPTVLFIAEHILRKNLRAAPKPMLLCAYGAGFSMHAFLLEG
jgi:predicted naringenin-chalcone synthase